MILAGVLLIIGELLWGVNVYAIFIPGIIFYFGSTLIWPNAFAAAFTPFGNIAGYAAALYTFMPTIGGGLFGGLASHVPDENQIPLALIFIIASALALLVYEVQLRKS